MDFARKQLEKYGWSDGKGLGKNENGISEALKPKIKRSVTGIGHDPAADFTEHWWSALYDKAAKNVEVKEKNGKTKKIKTKDTDFQITNSTYHLNKKSKKSKDDKNTTNEEYSDFFVKTAVLDGVKTEKVAKEHFESEEDEDIERKEKKDVFKMSDEELFAACEGRTAHKGARHGLKATGKLARIQRQEQLLLIQPQYTGYSHAKEINKCTDVAGNAIIINENTTKVLKKKKLKSLSDERNDGFESKVTNEQNIVLEKRGTKNNIIIEVVKKKKKKLKSPSNESNEFSFENTAVTDEQEVSEKEGIKKLNGDTSIEIKESTVKDKCKKSKHRIENEVTLTEDSSKKPKKKKKHI